MSCEHLVCAACSGPVSEGRCPVCREGRAKIHHHGFSVTPLTVALLVLAVLALVMIGQYLTP